MRGIVFLFTANKSISCQRSQGNELNQEEPGEKQGNQKAMHLIKPNGFMSVAVPEEHTARTKHRLGRGAGALPVISSLSIT